MGNLRMVSGDVPAFLASVAGAADAQDRMRAIRRDAASHARSIFSDFSADELTRFQILCLDGKRAYEAVQVILAERRTPSLRGEP